jgi:parallel beta-helix repeat protein
MKRKALALSLIVALLFPLVIGGQSANASFKTIIVPDDYPTIFTAVVNAMDGDTIFVKKGVYDGPINQTLLISKSIFLKGESANNTKILLHPPIIQYMLHGITTPLQGYADPIKIEANSVRLEGFTIASVGGGISIAGNAVQISGNILNLPVVTANASGIRITGNKMGDVSIGGSNNIIAGNTISGTSLLGIKLNGGSFNIVYNNTLVNAGLIIEGSSHMVYYNRFEYTNLRLESQTQNNTFYGNTFIGEDELVSVDATAYDNFWDNGVYGNFWSDYNGTDVFGDGIGDVPYIIDGNNQDRYPLMEPLIKGETFERPFPTTLVIAIVITLAFVIIGLIVYFKKRRH